ncbi:uncharacterized protein LOC117122550 [Anneissia japonica]|uniref:uncharacterized protein LOC117122550 n=1 Tax=Anneissia japonica TaxID=1529436 RepID=UPI0014255217|nr:uncharacterized protein LOC117122550 [Anneissia japonica]
MHDEVCKLKKTDFELGEMKPTQKDNVSGTEEANDEEESTGQTFSIAEFIPLMETSSQYGDKSSGLTQALSHYEFNSHTESMGFSSVRDEAFIPEFENSGDSWSNL